jgi:hypothetical protein
MKRLRFVSLQMAILVCPLLLAAHTSEMCSPIASGNYLINLQPECHDAKSQSCKEAFGYDPQACPNQLGAGFEFSYGPPPHACSYEMSGDILCNPDKGMKCGHYHDLIRYCGPASGE